MSYYGIMIRDIGNTLFCGPEILIKYGRKDYVDCVGVVLYAIHFIIPMN